ncbi:MAG: hypothetical protein QM711_04395 [Micropruina sp.]|uniref:hypothetical protein n=1 Tax=Micropruina sp. TaxID=2737536 RepID=UPI0039E242B8
MLVLYSSDARPRYVNDIATALAMPNGARFHFRYQARYLSPEVQRMLGENSLIGSVALICFIGNRNNTTAEEFLLPVRLAKVTAVEKIGDAYVFTLQASGYPDLGQWPRSRDEIVERGSSAVRQGISNNHDEYYAAYWDSSGSLGSKSSKGTEGWAGVTERLLLLETFAQTYLLRLELTDSKGSPMQVSADETGWLSFDPRRSYRVRAWFYGNSVDFGNRTIKLETDGEVLSSISDQRYVVRSRYDQVDFWFTPKASDQPKRTLLRVVSSPASPSDPSDIPTEVELRCLVTRPLAPRMLLALIAGASATAVAAPGLLGDAVPIEWRLLIAGVGALGVAVAAGLR